MPTALVTMVAGHGCPPFIPKPPRTDPRRRQSRSRSGACDRRRRARPRPPRTTLHVNPVRPSPETRTPSRGSLRPRRHRWLNSLTTLAPVPNTPDYQRGCGSGQACSFGPVWSDNTGAPDSHNGFGTRDDVLREQLSDVKTKIAGLSLTLTLTLLKPAGPVPRIGSSSGRAPSTDVLLIRGGATWPSGSRSARANVDTRGQMLSPTEVAPPSGA